MSTHVASGRASLRLSQLTNQFITHCRVEWQFGSQTLEKYRYCLGRIERALSDPLVADIREADVLTLKSELLARNASAAWQIVILSTLKRFLQFCREQLHIATLDPSAVTVPRRPRREVAYLTVEEVARFVGAIPLVTQKGQPHTMGLRFRALVEVLLGSAMRIGEVLSLNRTDIDFEVREARVIGKGNKQRTVFFTDRALDWLQRYLQLRTDHSEALFVAKEGRTRLSRVDIWRPFNLYRRRAGLNKPVRPHLLRHTAATQLLFNGCPVGHIKEILGHERLETTCRYYLGLDKRAAKAAHHQYLVYGPSQE